MNNESDVEVYWNSVAKKFGSNRTWHQLHPQEQMMVIQSINLLLSVLYN